LSDDDVTKYKIRSVVVGDDDDDDAVAVSFLLLLLLLLFLSKMSWTVLRAVPVTCWRIGMAVEILLDVVVAVDVVSVVVEFSASV
jgi:hypothetical protein